MAEFFTAQHVERQLAEAVANIPVNFGWRPSEDFVICRDTEGKVTAAYGFNIWDLNPIRLSATRISIMNFDTIFDARAPEQQVLIEEVRYLLFCLLFYVQTGHLGRISAGMLSQYFVTLRAAARYCYRQRENPLIGAVTLKKLFTTPAYLDAYSQWMIKSGVGGTQRKLMRAMIAHMVSIGEERLGYRLHGVFHLDFGRSDDTSNQHPVIPTRIYLDVINYVGQWTDVLYENRHHLEGFLNNFEDPLYGYSQNHQKVICPDLTLFHPEFDQAVRSSKVGSIFTDDFVCDGRGVLSSSILKIQWLLKTVIHTYTGMRDQEVLRLPYECIDEEEIVAATVIDGATRDKPMIVRVISTTTKFYGYRKSASWLATDEVCRAVEIARAICRAISKLFGVRPEDMPLFLNPAIINRSDTKVGVPRWNAVSKPQPLLTGFIITDADFQELQCSDPGRDFSNDPKFQVGSGWSFTSHQFRRSLAFYGSSSGFISLPTLRQQFKHLSTQMTRYYANNFERLVTIFGYYDEKSREFILPKNHVLFEYQTGVPLNIAYDLLDHAFGSDTPIFGGAGSYISTQRKKLEQGDVHIADVRKETEKLAADGKISLKPTLLGVCTYVGKCESYLLGHVTSCTSCADGIIEKHKLERAIADDEADLALYEPGSGEYQVIKAELDSLKKFHQKFISVVEL